MVPPAGTHQIAVLQLRCPIAAHSLSEGLEREARMDVMPKGAALLLAISLIALAGCATAQDIRQRDEAACTSYGFKLGTTDFASCLQRESIARRYGYGYGYYPTWGATRWCW
jgi:hypothetical protein